MALKLYILELKDKNVPLANKRNVEHLLVKHSGIKITLSDAIPIISSANVGNAVEVLFNSNKIDLVESVFGKHGLSISPKIKA